VKKSGSNFYIVIFCVALIISTSVLGVLFLFAPNVFAAAPPQILHFQGRLTDSNGDLLGGSSGTTHYFRFSIHDASSSGNQLWPFGNATPCTHSLTVTEGVFVAGIGDTTECGDVLDYDFSSNDNIYLEVRVSSDNVDFEELTPRQRIVGAAFAQLASAVVATSSPSVRTTFGTSTPIGNSTVTIEATSTNAIPLSIRAATGQTANLFQIQNATTADLFSVGSGGLITFVNASTSQISITDTLFIGGTATTTITGDTATSTFAGGIATNGVLDVNGTSATSTFANGIIFENGGIIFENGSIRFATDICNGFGNGGVLTTDTDGSLICEADDSSSGGEWTDDGKYLRPDEVGDSILLGSSNFSPNDITTNALLALYATSTTGNLIFASSTTSFSGDFIQFVDDAGTEVFSIDASAPQVMIPAASVSKTEVPSHCPSPWSMMLPASKIIPFANVDVPV